MKQILYKTEQIVEGYKEYNVPHLNEKGELLYQTMLNEDDEYSYLENGLILFEDEINNTCSYVNTNDKNRKKVNIDYSFYLKTRDKSKTKSLLARDISIFFLKESIIILISFGKAFPITEITPQAPTPRLPKIEKSSPQYKTKSSLQKLAILL